MELNKLEELSLEYLSTQIDPIDYLLLYSKIFEENDCVFEKISVKLWYRLYLNRNILIVINDEFNEYIRSNYRVKLKKNTTNLYDIDVTLLDEEELERYIGNTKLICSNSFRIKILNLGLYDQVIKSNERFRLLMMIASRRYSGSWLSDLSHDLKLSPRDLFFLLNCLCKIGLVYKLVIPQNMIYKYLIENINEKIEIKYDVREESNGTDKEESISKNSASICFFHKYFVLDKLSENIKMLCFSEVTRNCESTMLEILEKAQNNVMLESDWRRSYFNIAFGELNNLNVKPDNHLISKSYLSFKRSLETKNKITVIFAWCPQTSKYERSIMLLKNQKDEILKLKSVNMVHVINMKTEETEEDSDEEPSEYVSRDLRGHSIKEYLYNIIKISPNGITAKEINKYIAIKYKMLTKILLNMEDIGLIRKDTDRNGKIFMYRYYTINKIRSMIKIEDESDDSCRSVYTQYEAAEDVKLNNSNTETPCNIKGISSNININKYNEFLKNQRMKYYDEEVYNKDYKMMFGEADLPRQANTQLFKKRMILMVNYLKEFKAATLTNIANFYGDMENATRPDRKTVMRVSEVVLRKQTKFKKIKCDELKGANLSLTVLYDTTHFTNVEAYKHVRNNINEKRNLVCTQAAHIKTKINSHFKNPEHVESMTNEVVDILDVSDANISNMKIQMPLLVKNVSVNQQNTNLNYEAPDIFSQKTLSLNGYIYPVMTRSRVLHTFLIKNFKNQTFTTTQVLKTMTLENYFQLIGCGYNLSNVSKYINSKIDDMPQEYVNILTNKRRDPINILNNHLNFLYRIKLLSFKSDRESVNNDKKTLIQESESIETSSNNSEENENSNKNIEVEKKDLKWRILKNVYIYDFKINEKVKKYDVFKDNIVFWNCFKAEVDEYIASENQKVPDSLPVKEVFSKKNWKKVVYLNSKIKSELDKVITLWMNMCCNGLHSKSLIKLYSNPHKIIKTLSKKFNLTNTQIQSQILARIKSQEYESHSEDDKIVNKILSNIYKGTELLWITRYVISEKIINKIFINIIKNNHHTQANVNEVMILDEENDSLEMNQKSYPDIWKYTCILFNYKYTENECKLIFDYIINKSNLNLRLLKKFRKLRTSDIIKYIMKKSTTTTTNTYNTATTNLSVSIESQNEQDKLINDQIDYKINKVKLKCMMFTSSTQTLQTSSLVNHDVNDYKKILKSWYEYGWVVRGKMRSKLPNVYKLSILSKIKLFPKYSNIYFYAKQLLSYMELYNYNKNVINEALYKLTNGTNAYSLMDYGDMGSGQSVNSVSIISDCLDMDIYSIYNMAENFNAVNFETKWNYKPQEKNKTNYYRLIHGGISKHIKSLTNNISVTNVKANITAIQNKLSEYKYEIDNEKLTIIPKQVLCEHEMTDILNPLQFNHQIQNETYEYNYTNENNLNENIYNDNEKNNRSFKSNEKRNHLTNYTMSTLNILKLSKSNNNKINTISDLMLYVMGIYEFDYSLKIMEKKFYKLIKVVKSKEKEGISHSKLIQILTNKINNEVDYDVNINSDNTKMNNISVMVENNDTLLCKILIYTAAILKLIIMLPNGREFIYLYWEYNEHLTISDNRNNDLENNCNNINDKINSLNNNMTNTNVEESLLSNHNNGYYNEKNTSNCEIFNGNSKRMRPEYVSEILWMLYEKNSIKKPLNIKDFTHIIKDLLPEDPTKYLKVYSGGIYSSFVTSEGYMNLRMVAYVSLKIYSIVKEKPGITTHQIWNELAILDECEVEIIIESLITLKIISSKQIKVESSTNHLFSSNNNTISVVNMLYPQESSYVLWKFKSVLLTN